MASPRSLAKHDADMSPRKREILEIAAQLFAERGYRGTSIRDIGKESGVLGGSLYHHIKSKDVLFVELHNAALDMAADRIDTAVAEASDPWDRLERACVTLVETQLDVNSLTFPMMNDFREVPEEVRQQLIARRDVFEDVFRRLVEDMLGAAGAIEAIYSVLAIQDQILPPSLNIEQPMKEAEGFNLIGNGSRPATVKHVVSNALGFGGVNAALVFSRYADRELPVNSWQ